MALIQLLNSGWEQNLSGRPKAGSRAAMRRHMSQPPPGFSSGRKGAGESWEPRAEFSTQPPGVRNTRSFSVRSMCSSAPSRSSTRRLACLRPGRRSNSTSTTLVLKWNWTPCASRYLSMGRIMDSYWL